MFIKAGLKIYCIVLWRYIILVVVILRFYLKFFYLKMWLWSPLWPQEGAMGCCFMTSSQGSAGMWTGSPLCDLNDPMCHKESCLLPLKPLTLCLTLFKTLIYVWKMCFHDCRWYDKTFWIVFVSGHGEKSQGERCTDGVALLPLWEQLSLLVFNHCAFIPACWI